MIARTRMLKRDWTCTTPNTGVSQEHTVFIATSSNDLAPLQ